VPVLVSDRKRITVMAGETPLYDASIAADGDVFLACVSLDLANIVRFGCTDVARRRFAASEHTAAEVKALLAEPSNV
jgi:hypothetical protein